MIQAIMINQDNIDLIDNNKYHHTTNKKIKSYESIRLGIKGYRLDECTDSHICCTLDSTYTIALGCKGYYATDICYIVFLCDSFYVFIFQPKAN